MDELWSRILEDLNTKLGEPAQVVDRETVKEALRSVGLPPMRDPEVLRLITEPLTVTKYGAYVPITDDMAMDYGLIPDTRPPVRYSRRLRLRWWRQRKVDAVRMRVGSWIAGVDLSERDDW